MKSLEQFSDKDFGECSILFRKEHEPEHVCLFASHTFSPFLPEYVYYYLNEVRNAGLSIIFISSSKISEKDAQRLSEIAVMVVEKDNKGTDFGAWCSVLRYLNYGEGYKSLYLCNDSVFGPLVPFTTLHEKFLELNEEIIGITDSHQGAGYHIQSYFVGLKAAVLQRSEWKDFWIDMTFHQEKGKVIEFYEIGLSQALIKAGFQHFIWTNWSNKLGFDEILFKVSQSEMLRHRWLNRILFDQKQIIFDINPSSFLWKELITVCKNPFIKRELFIYPHLFEECEVDEAWEQLLTQSSNYPVELIRYFLIDYFLHRTIASRLAEFGEVQFSRLSIEEERLPVNEALDFSRKMPLFEALSTLIPVRSEARGNLLKKQLDEMKVRSLTVDLSLSTAQGFRVTLIYLEGNISKLDKAALARLRLLFKKVENPVVVVPDNGAAAIVSSLLSVRQDGLVLEKEFYLPLSNRKIVEIFHHLAGAEGNAKLNVFQRPSISDIVKDALGNSQITNFVLSNFGLQPIDLYSTEFNRDLYSSREDYLKYTSIKNKYRILYEETPWWYKKIGQLLKLFSGNKRLSIDFTDKGRKPIYRPTAEDISHWYYLQYEVLPGWYKRIAVRLTKNKNQ
jgi:Rhamnan synthesis protein F